MFCKSCNNEEHECEVWFIASGLGKTLCSCPQMACRAARAEYLGGQAEKGRHDWLL